MATATCAWAAARGRARAKRARATQRGSLSRPWRRPETREPARPQRPRRRRRGRRRWWRGMGLGLWGPHSLDWRRARCVLVRARVAVV